MNYVAYSTWPFMNLMYRKTHKYVFSLYIIVEQVIQSLFRGKQKSPILYWIAMQTMATSGPFY